MSDRHPLLHGVWPPAQSVSDGVLDYTRPDDNLTADSNVLGPDPNFLEQDALLASVDETQSYPGLAGASLEIISSAEVMYVQQNEGGFEAQTKRRPYPEAMWFKIPIIILTIVFTTISSVARGLLFNKTSIEKNQTDEYCMLFNSVMWNPLLFLVPATIYRLFFNKNLPVFRLPLKSWLLGVLLGVFAGLGLLCTTYSTAQTILAYDDTVVRRPRTPVFLTSILGMSIIPLIVLFRFIVFSDSKYTHNNRITANTNIILTIEFNNMTVYIN